MVAMTQQPPSAVESYPEFYPDVIAAGGLAAALAQVAADQGLTLGAPTPAPEGSPGDVRFPALIPGRADLTVSARRRRRSFRLENNESGIAHARGYTADLTEVARAVAAWFAGSDPRGMKAAAPFIELPLMAEARATGSAESVVETNWQLRRDAWRRLKEFKPDDWCEPGALTAQRDLIDAAYAEPRLRRLYAMTSHFNLWFSQCTDSPFARVGAVIEPRSDGSYGVWMRQHRDEGESFDTPHAAVARAAELLPPDCGGAVLGTAADVPAQR